MAQALTDEERVLKLIERARLLIAIDDEMPTETKLNTQPMLKLLEAFSVAAYRHVHQNSANGAVTPSTPTTENAPTTEPNHP